MLALSIFHIRPAAAGPVNTGRPQIFWKGKLEGTHDLLFQKTSIAVLDLTGPPVTGQVYRFTEPLPGDAMSTDVDPRTSRGYVRVLEQPSMDNDYTLRIRIEDRQAGAFVYGIAVSWDPEAVVMSSSDLRRPKKAVLSRDAAWHAGGHPIKVSCRAIWLGEIHGDVRLAIGRGKARVLSGTATGRLNLMKDVAWPKGIYSPEALATSKETTAAVVDRPTRGNGYTAIIEASGDTTHATIELAW